MSGVVPAGNLCHGAEHAMVKVLRLTLLGLLAFPAAAHAAGDGGMVQMVVRDVPLGARGLQAVAAPGRFNMLGLHWRGAGVVIYRTHRIGGGWGPWTVGDADTSPDARSHERFRTRDWTDGTPDWTGASDGVQFRTRGPVARLRAFYLQSRVDAAPLRTVSMTSTPQIVSRFGWAANEAIVRAKPQIAPQLRFAIIHHTVNSNTYSRAEAPALVRGIQAYHVKGNGWNDIGYNFLIDRFGTVYEGRGGGAEKNVVGAHSAGFNTGSVGIALLGTYTTATATPAQKEALVQLLAWRLDVAHVDPLSFVAFRSLGNSRFPRGAPVNLRAISGHRDTYFSECPGAALYAQLPSIAAAVAQTGLPKIYEPQTNGDPSEGVRFTAGLSSASAWTVTIADANGTVVAKGKGSGTKVDWPWVAAGPGPYRWTIEAGSARPATGVFGSGPMQPPPALAGLSAAPSVLTPDPSGFGASTHIVFTLGAAATVTAQVTDTAGKVVQALAQAQPMQAGQQALDWSAASIPDGRYKLLVSTGAAKSSLDLIVDRSLTNLIANVSAISPNGDGVQDSATFSFSLAAALPLRLEVQQNGAAVATLFSGTRGPGPQVVDWSGKDANGVALPDGSYQVVATVTDALGNIAVPVPLVVDSTAPTLTLLDPKALRFTLSEPATVNLVVNGAAETKVEPAGTFTVPPPKAGVQTVTAQARDAAGNVSATVSG
jgi:hypothetical protein